MASTLRPLAPASASHPSSLGGPSLSQHPTFLETREVSGGCGLNPSPGDTLREITSLWDSASLSEAGEERRSWKDKQSLEGRNSRKTLRGLLSFPERGLKESWCLRNLGREQTGACLVAWGPELGPLQVESSG